MFKKFFLILITLGLVGTVGCIGDKMANNDELELNDELISQLPNQGEDETETSPAADFRYDYREEIPEGPGERGSGAGTGAGDDVSISFQPIINIDQGVEKIIDLDATLRNYEGTYTLTSVMKQEDRDKVELSAGSGAELILLSYEPGRYNLKLTALDGEGNELASKNIQIRVNRNELKITSIDLSNQVDYSTEETVKAKIKIKGGSEEYEYVQASTETEGLEVEVVNEDGDYFLTLLPNKSGEHEITITVKDENENFEIAEKTVELKINNQFTVGTIIEIADFNSCNTSDVKLIVKRTNAHAKNIVKNEEGYVKFPRVDDKFKASVKDDNGYPEPDNYKMSKDALLTAEFDIQGGVGPFEVKAKKYTWGLPYEGARDETWIIEDDNGFEIEGRTITWDREFLGISKKASYIQIIDKGCSDKVVFEKMMHIDMGCRIANFNSDDGGVITFKAEYYDEDLFDKGFCKYTKAQFFLTSQENSFGPPQVEGRAYYLSRGGNNNRINDAGNPEYRMETRSQDLLSSSAPNRFCVEEIISYAVLLYDEHCAGEYPSLRIKKFRAKWASDESDTNFSACKEKCFYAGTNELTGPRNVGEGKIGVGVASFIIIEDDDGLMKQWVSDYGLLQEAFTSN